MKRRNRVFAFAGAAVMLMVLARCQVLVPMEERIAARRTRLAALDAAIARADSDRRRLAGIRAESRMLEDRLDTLKSMLPLERETDGILREIDAAARTASMRVLRIAPRPILDREVYSEWAWDFQVESTYHDVGLFLDAVGRLPRTVRIADLSMTAAGEAADGSVRAAYTATTFVYREEPPPAAVEP